MNKNEITNKLFNKISELNKWLYIPSGLNLMNVIDDIFNEKGWRSDVPGDKLQKDLEILKKTSMEPYIESTLERKYKNFKLVLEGGKYHLVNKLNTNYLDQTDMIIEMVSRSIELDNKKGMEAFNRLYSDPKGTLTKWKPYMKALLVKYFIELGSGLDDFKKFTKHARKMTEIGDRSEMVVINKLIKSGFNILYRGSEGDPIDMIFGCDLIVYRNDFGYKTIQVKSKIYWDKVKYYRVDWVANNSGEIFDKWTMELVNI
jgi:hypothetical protein